MELRHLRYFVAVAEEENVSRAAVKLRVSQPGVSRQIRDLEDEIGFSLFERSAKSVRLTAAGKVFLGEARAVLQRANEAVAKARAVSGGGAGELNIGYAPSLTVRILPPALRKFQDQFPNVRVALHDLTTEEMLAQLGEKKLQVALTVKPPAKQLRGLRFEELARYAMRVAMAPKHPLAKSKLIHLDQIAREPLIAYSRREYPEYHTMLDRLFAQAARKPRIAGEHDGVTSLIAAVESGRGLALVPECLACMVGERLKLIPLQHAPSAIPVCAIWRDDAPELVKQFIAAAKMAKPD
jgi:LysR family transcriptional regulator, benzoate and cis,cis-muconate-responsive activator of ben and cat genes